VLAAGASAATSCEGPPRTRASAGGDFGAISLALNAGPNLTLDTVTYSLTAPGVSREGSLDVRQSTVLSATIGGVPAAAGYFLALAATLSDGVTTCSGAASFDVGARATTMVVVHLLCHEPARTGRIQIGGTINICPLVDAVSANPGSVPVGGTVGLSGAGHDTDKAPAPLTYQWTATSGTFSDAAATSPTFTCTAAGTATVTLTVSDGDCSDAVSVDLSCTPVAPAPAKVVINEVESSGGVPGDWVELYNAGGSAADLSGLIFKDNDDTHGYAIPAGTTLAPGAYYLL
jgi:PKD repeat protein